MTYCIVYATYLFKTVTYLTS